MCTSLSLFPRQTHYSLAVQKKANCVIGQDYPSPIVDEKQEKLNCLTRIKVAFASKLHGNDPTVLDGTAEKRLRKDHVSPFFFIFPSLSIVSLFPVNEKEQERQRKPTVSCILLFHFDRLFFSISFFSFFLFQGVPDPKPFQQPSASSKM